MMQIQAVLLDIDGTIMIGNEPIPGAAEAIRYLQDRKIPYRYVSNGTRKSGKNVLKKLERLGVWVSIDEICTPAMAAIQYLQEKNINACNLLVTGDLMNDFHDAGIDHDQKANTVVIGDAGDRFTYETMNAAFRSLMRGGELIALEKDRYWKDIDGLSLSAGPFVSALEYGTGCKAVIMGKPSPIFFSSAMRGFGVDKAHVVMIGDDIMTDVKGAQDAGLLGVITFTGKFRPGETEGGKVIPDISINSIAELPNYCTMRD
jgi:HAD superfamily hydrolase (TIGR01458 family)